MLRPIIETLAPEVSGALAYRQVEAIVRHHRIQASPGYREAAGHCREVFRQAGIQAEVVAYPADGRTAFWGYPSFREWHAEAATLWLLEPERQLLASFDQCPLSLIQRSYPTPPGGIEAELAVVDDADRPASYEGRDVAGKLLLITGQPNLARELAMARGAAGLIVDHMPEWPPVRLAMDLPDARSYSSFWDGGGETRPAFGFILSPRQGAKLRGWVTRGTPVRLRAEVRSRHYAGALENVEAFLPGDTAEEILLVAHLCHPRPSANDNASGAGALLEAARALAAVLTRGDLPPPRRRIRFLLVPEMTGTFAYLSANPDRIPLTVAGLNLDMVGQRQDLCLSSLQVERPPRAIPGFAGDLAAATLAELTGGGRNFAGSSGFALFRHTVTSFSGGSDHYILSDPLVGVPCPMVIQFPDRYYHTSEDTLDKVDPVMLERVALLAAAYAYWAATAGELEAMWLASAMAGGLAPELRAAPRPGLQRLLAGRSEEPGIAAETAFARRRASFLLERKLADLRSLTRLAPQGAALASLLGRQAPELERQTALYQEELGRLAAAAGAGGVSPAGTAAAEQVLGLRPRRRLRGPVEARHHLGRIPPGEERERWQAFELEHRSHALLRTLALYWADGTRTLGEIIDLVELETGRREAEYLIRSMELLARLELVDL